MHRGKLGVIPPVVLIMMDSCPILSTDIKKKKTQKLPSYFIPGADAQDQKETSLSEDTQKGEYKSIDLQELCWPDTRPMLLTSPTSDHAQARDVLGHFVSMRKRQTSSRLRNTNSRSPWPRISSFFVFFARESIQRDLRSYENQAESQNEFHLQASTITSCVGNREFS